MFEKKTAMPIFTGDLTRRLHHLKAVIQVPNVTSHLPNGLRVLLALFMQWVTRLEPNRLKNQLGAPQRRLEDIR